ncbi:Receptor-like protein 35 [Sesamum alatum]|uniref:Receptor-like protein 35 n=1 Tax=Sesamum alatum TaxID=300844 RepID=A0AAE1XY83_9LAMI|nr:Receptor-like protein 35 [Sesamum alatum]
MLVLDLSSNRLEGPIPESFFTLERLDTLYLSHNFFNGTVQLEKFQRLHNLTELDLSYNNLSVDTSITNTKRLAVLNLAGNNISGHIPDKISVNCTLEILDISQNYLEGSLPASLANCKSLQVLNVGNNNIDDSFPCMLPSSLRVLVLRFNRFHGHVRCRKSWPNLQIIDIASNNFTGYLYPKSFSRMMLEKDAAQSRSDYLNYGDWFIYYQAKLKVVLKGKDLELVKILTIYTIIDFSCNNFQGEIPNAIGELSWLPFLNLSHNALTGTIPRSLGNLTQLQSLDLSTNQLMGKIPKELTRLSFLSFLNLSNNQLVGPIPSGRQFQTFSPDSFKGNTGLCGFPLNISCGTTGENDNVPPPNPHGKEEVIEWEYVSIALGYVVGLGSILWLVFFSRRFRHKFNDQTEQVFEKIFKPKDRKKEQRRRVNRRRYC